MNKMFRPENDGDNQTKPTLFMFSGQGSQYYQMGKDLYDGDESFRRHMGDLDALVMARLGESVVDHIYDEQNRIGDSFDRLLYTHIAIFIIEIALTRMLADKGIRPDMVMGASLGELVAACVSGVVSVEEGIDLVLAQAKIVEANCSEAGMLAILDSELSYSDTAEIHQFSELSSINAKGFFVVSGTGKSLQKIETFLKARDVGFQRLPVRYGFHSSLIDDCESEYKFMLGQTSWQAANIPFVSCTTAEEMNVFDKHYFWKVMRQPIKLSETIQMLELDGNYNYVDISASGTMANAVNNNLRSNSSSNVFTSLSPFGGNLSRLESTKCFFTTYKINETTENKMKVFAFPGQGSQVKGMGEGLFDAFPEYEQIADTVLGYSIRTLCIEDPNRELNKTQFTQPALFVVNALTYLKRIKDGDAKPDYFIGHSLGEFDALFAAGVFDFETGLKLVKKRGALMSLAKNGGMAAVMGCDADQVMEILKANNLHTIDVANFNSPEQIVLSGPRADIINAASFFEQTGVTYFPLNVSAAFHSRYMESCKEEFGKYLDSFEFNAPEISVISNVTALPYSEHKIKQNIKLQITSSVKWTDSVRYLIAQGCVEFIELGPGNVLRKLYSVIEKDAPRPPISAFVQQDKEPILVTLDSESEKSSEPFLIEKAPAVSIDINSEKRGSNGASIDPESLGSESFKRDYKLRYAYLSGSMYKGISSKELVVKMGRSSYLAFLGTGGLKLDQVEEQLCHIKEKLNQGEPFGANLLHDLKNPDAEMASVKLFLRLGVKYLEVSAFMQVSAALVYFRLHSLERNAEGVVISKNKLIAKISRPEVATVFLNPAPERIVKRLFDSNMITQEQVEMAKEVPVADDLCVEADSGGHTDMGVIATLLPAIMRLRDELRQQHSYQQEIRVGAAGGIGTPEAAAAAFVLGADFIVTGSINQCTVEAGTSNEVKDLLQNINVQDTTYAPAGDMFELGAKVQVLKKGVFFPARANKLYDLWRYCDSIESIDPATRKQLEDKYFKRSIEDVWSETRQYLQKSAPAELAKAENNPKQKMALIFKWYFIHTTRLAMRGDTSQRVDYQVHCGPALGAFNQWVKGTELESWKNRNVDKIADKLMTATAEFIGQRLFSFG